MKELLLTFFIFISQFIYCQNFIYSTKKFSVLENNENPKWSKWYRNESIIVFDVDSVYSQDTTIILRRLIIYSKIYQEIELHTLNYYNIDSKGNYSFNFIGTDIWGNDCDFVYYYYNKKNYFIISYKELSIKYVLRKKRWTSFDLETGEVSFSSITKNGYYVSG